MINPEIWAGFFFGSSMGLCVGILIGALMEISKTTKEK